MPPELGAGVTPGAANVQMVVALLVVLILSVPTLIVAAWDPEHRCKWKGTCPHWRQDQDDIERRAAARKARNDHFHS